MIVIDMEMPTECHECRLQAKVKGDELNEWYMRRCMVMGRTIEYPKPEWCPLMTFYKPKEDA